MKQNARYKGGSGTGVDLTVPLEDGQQRRIHVDQGDELPADFRGVAIDAEFIAGLLEQESEWERVDETPDEREARLAAQKDQLEIDEAAAAARAEHDAAAEKAAAAMAKAEKAIAVHRAAGDEAAAAAAERTRAQQVIRQAEQTIRETTKDGTS